MLLPQVSQALLRRGLSMYCQKCGKTIPDGSKFCQFCGAEQIEQEHTLEEKMSKEQPKNDNNYLETADNLIMAVKKTKSLPGKIFVSACMIIGLILGIMIFLRVGAWLQDEGTVYSTNYDPSRTTSSTVEASSSSSSNVDSSATSADLEGTSGAAQGNGTYLLLPSLDNSNVLPNTDSAKELFKFPAEVSSTMNYVKPEAFNNLFDKDRAMSYNALEEGQWWSSDGTAQLSVMSSGSNTYTISFSWLGNSSYDFSTDRVVGDTFYPEKLDGDDNNNLNYLNIVAADENKEVLVVNPDPRVATATGLPECIVMYKDLIS